MKMPWPYTAKRTDGRVLLHNLPATDALLSADDDHAFTKAMGG